MSNRLPIPGWLAPLLEKREAQRRARERRQAERTAADAARRAKEILSADRDQRSGTDRRTPGERRGEAE